jgi:type VI secretion system secreted protein Hcp
MRKAGEGQIDFLLIKLKEARVTQVEHDTDESGSTRESVTMAFRKVEVEYRLQQASGGRGAAHVFTDELIESA